MASTGWQQLLLHSQYILSSSPVAPNVLSPRKWSPTRQPNPNRVTKRPINATGGWGTSPPKWKFDPWATSKPDTDTTASSGEEATTATTISRATGSASPPPLSPVIPPSASQRAASPGNQSVAGSSLLAYLDDELHLPRRRTQPLDQGNKAVTWVDRALGAMVLASRGAQP